MDKTSAPVTDTDLLDIARRNAYEHRDDHGYLPKTEIAAYLKWHPHAWVMDALREVAAMADLYWLPIEQAPRDGSRVLLHIEGVDRAVPGEWNGASWTTVDGNLWTGRKVLAFRYYPALPAVPVAPSLPVTPDDCDCPNGRADHMAGCASFQSGDGDGDTHA